MNNKELDQIYTTKSSLIYKQKLSTIKLVYEVNGQDSFTSNLKLYVISLFGEYEEK